MAENKHDQSIFWLILGVALLSVLCGVLGFFAYRTHESILALRENHHRLLENQKALQSDLAGLTKTTKESLENLHGKAVTVGAEVHELKVKLEPIKAFVRKGELVLIE